MTGISNVYADMVAVAPTDPRRIYMGDDDWWIYRSEDGGDTFTPASSARHKQTR